MDAPPDLVPPDTPVGERKDIQVMSRISYTPEAAFRKFSHIKDHSKALYMKKLEPKLVADEAALPSQTKCVAVCVCCSKQFSIANLSNVGKTHFDAFGNCNPTTKAGTRAGNKRHAIGNGLLYNLSLFFGTCATCPSIEV